MRRSIQEALYRDLKQKIVILSGPRQAGKTTLAKTLNSSYEYLNFDRKDDRKKLLSESWNREKEILILDELHKMKNWKQWLKGVCDTEKRNNIIVTGSARLDTFKKVGDSMAGRYFAHHLFPLDLKELKEIGFQDTKDNFERLWKLSGFPEPFLSNSESDYKRWRKTHLDIILRQDLPELEAVKRIVDIETLMILMLDRIGSPLSYNSLREDLQTDDKTIKRWLQWLENSYAVFRVTPFSKNVKYTIKKAPKFYLFDYSRIDDAGARLENFVAFSLLKNIQLKNDLEGETFSLHYLMNKQHQEIDFLICKDRKPHWLIEVKQSDSNPSKNFKYFTPELRKQNPSLKQFQLVKELDRPFSTKDGIFIEPLIPWLENFGLD